ncbi:YebC/PmpR family DNA-binding transcriptional regulator [Candidatus Palauibacter sp.]|uniref:YebC/PmpR family DNA-binding transcriptional regulator n=1 Tax=Candidatus Palauibacter sp. TaxID=3101350 RepID=UPI003AF227A3
MAGHSKWSKIKRQKAVTDKAKGKLFSKLGREIAVAAREGGGDPDFNPRLRTAIDNAKGQRMPAENIDRAVRRGTGDLPGTTFEEVTHEGYAPRGVALFLECLTDNPRRTLAELRHLLDKRGGNLGQSGSVAWMFERKGQIFVPAERGDEDTTLDAALEAGAENFESEDGMYLVTTTAADFHDVLASMRGAGIPVAEADLAMVPNNTVRLAGREAEKILGILEALDEHDDVLKVNTNVDLEDADWEAV